MNALLENLALDSERAWVLILLVSGMDLGNSSHLGVPASSWCVLDDAVCGRQSRVLGF